MGKTKTNKTITWVRLSNLKASRTKNQERKNGKIIFKKITPYFLNESFRDLFF